MVHLNQELIYQTNGQLNTEAWTSSTFTKYTDSTQQKILHQCITLASFSENKQNSYNESLLAQGLTMANILSDLNADANTLAAAILYPAVEHVELSIEDVTEHLGTTIASLIQGSLKMAAISALYQTAQQTISSQHNIDNIRKMFLAMVSDVRIVLIKLAEILYILRHAKNIDAKIRAKIASEAMYIYGPLANRLGMIRIKWEIEDLAFRYLEPEKYKEISHTLQESRLKREKYIEKVIIEIKALLQTQLKNFQVTGRAKHIYSIYRKMSRKKVAIGGLYDVSALRILTNSIEDCYKALSLIHAQWKPITQEFDDYIAKPKPNGYRSIHTAVIGPDNKNIEIQIRTYDIHNESELGAAAHWAYKENAKQSNYENKIAWLRQLLNWQHDISANEPREIQQIFNDRIYVVTPRGDIFDLPHNATPLDFAYHVHSDLGHRCMGAKVNDNIVPLTYKLKNGEKVEVITAKQPRPSRDWLNPNLEFLTTSRAKSKVLQWFKKQEHDKQINAGQEILNKELSRLNLKPLALEKIAKALNFKTNDELLSALGSGELKMSAILDVLEPTQSPIPTSIEIKPTKQKTPSGDLKIAGVDNLLTHFANCCRPLPGDKIIGYITQTRGISIHKQSCTNILNAQKNRPERLLTVAWGEQKEQFYPVELVVKAFDRVGLIRDITDILADNNITVSSLNLSPEKKDNIANISMTISIPNVASLSKIIAKISKIAHVIEVRRKN